MYAHLYFSFSLIARAVEVGLFRLLEFRSPLFEEQFYPVLLDSFPAA